MLERELTELGRAVQRRGDIVYHLQEIFEIDEKRGMGGGCKEEIPAACGVTGQEQAGGGEKDHQPARGGVGQEGGRGQGSLKGA